MNAFLNNCILTETQKNALFAFGELDKTGTGVNLMIAASMCEGELTKAILMSLSDLVESVGITDASQFMVDEVSPLDIFAIPSKEKGHGQ